MKWFMRFFLALLTLFCPIVLAACYGSPYDYPDSIYDVTPAQDVVEEDILPMDDLVAPDEKADGEEEETSNS
jgi:hypothetical protein